MRIEEFEFLKPISKGAYGSGNFYSQLATTNDEYMGVRVRLCSIIFEKSVFVHP